MIIFAKTLTSKNIYTIETKATETVEDVKEKIAVQICVNPEQQTLYYSGIKLQDELTLEAQKVPNEATLHISLRMGGAPQSVNWASFVQSTKPAALDIDVPLKQEIWIQLKKKYSKPINALLLINMHALGKKNMQNAWHNYFDANGIFWTDYTFSQRIVVLELREEFARLSGPDMMKHIDKVRYNWAGINKTYYGGDTRSWQRYTTKMPVKGQIQRNTDTHLSFLPDEPLKQNTWYALVLLHSNHEFGDAIYDDFLVPFKTISTEPVTPQAPQPSTLECCVCMVKQVSVVYLPCGHICCCEGCDARVLQCPKCRQPITNKHKVFF